MVEKTTDSLIMINDDTVLSLAVCALIIHRWRHVPYIGLPIVKQVTKQTPKQIYIT